MKINLYLIKIIISLLLFIISLFIKNSIVYYILIYLIYIILSYEIIIQIIKNIRKKKIFDENLLMIIASIGAICLKENTEALAIMFFYQIGEYIEDLSTKKSRKSILDLLDLKSDKAYLKNKGEYVDINDIKINDIIVVKPGEKIPLDGIVVKGNTNLNTANITGESIPKNIKINDEVMSGTINLLSPIEIKVTKLFYESTSSIIMKLIENADEKKSNQEKFITKFSKYYTKIVIFIALILLLIPLILKENTTIWINKSLLFLVTSCPCALIISVPLGYFIAIALCSKKGVVIKGSNVIENLSKIKTIIMDKTGTITKGNFRVTKIIPLYKTKEEVLKIAAYAEYYSNHPIAIAIKNEYKANVYEKEISDYQEISGKGIMLKINNNNVLVGNNTLFNEKKIKYPKVDFIGTVILVSLNNEYIGTIVISDEIKKSSIDIVKNLKEIGIKKTVMLSGDNEEIVKKVGKKLNIDECYANLLPQDKLEILKLLKKENDVLFVGDGMNDSLVLLESNVGMSMGQIGSDTAIEASDAIIMNDDLNNIIDVLNISIKTKQVVLFNIIFSIFIKLLILILGMFSITNMIFAVFADVGVMIITIINSLRIGKL